MTKEKSLNTLSHLELARGKVALVAECPLIDVRINNRIRLLMESQFAKGSQKYSGKIILNYLVQVQVQR
jgi:hypothetical protein